MTKTKVLAGLSIMAALALTTAGVTTAQDAIAQRKALMKEVGGATKLSSEMIKGEKPYDAAAIKAALDATAAACADWDKWWGEDTQKGETVESFAKPEVWTDAEGWKAAGAKFGEAYTAISAAADEAAFKAAFPALGESCGGCHEKFRRPKG